MAYLPNYSWDVFISYARKDNEARDQRVAELQKDIVDEINKGLDGYIDVFLDQRSLRAYNTIASILQEVKKSAILIVIGSPNWIKSKDSCLKELNAFIDHRQDSTRIVVAEIEPPKGELRWPATLPDNLRIEFWAKRGVEEIPIMLDAGEQDYKLNVKKLARDVRERILALAGETPEAAVGPGPAKGSPTGARIGKQHAVFLAYSPHEVADQRQSVRDYLEGEKVVVWPQPFDPPAKPEYRDAAIRQGLAKSTIFVQFLGLKPLPGPGGPAASPTFSQLEQATALKMTRILWRPDMINPEGFTAESDAPYRDVIRKAINGSPATLSQSVMSTLDAELSKEEDRIVVNNGGTNLIISADPEDEDASISLIEACDEWQCDAMLDNVGHNSLFRAQWLRADVLGFVQGRADIGSFIARYHVVMNAWKAEGENKKLKGLALIYAPPKKTSRAHFTSSIAKVKVIDLSENWTVQPFAAWLAEIGLTKKASEAS